MDKIQLSPTTQDRTISLFAQGFTRPQVMDLLLQDTPELQNLDFDEATLRKKLSDYLRSFDPTSNQFAEKHRATYQERREAVYQSLRENVSGLQMQFIQQLSKTFNEINGICESLKIDLDMAEQTTPVGNSEYLATVGMLVRLKEAQGKTVATISTLMDHLTPAPDSQIPPPGGGQPALHG